MFGRKECRFCVLGVAAGVGAAALGYYLYKKNKDKVNTFLLKQLNKVEKVISEPEVKEAEKIAE